MDNKIKIGFLVDPSLQVPAWYRATIDEVLKDGSVSVYFLMVHAPDHKKPKESMGFRLFRWYEKKWFQSAYDARAVSDISRLIDEAGERKLVLPSTLGFRLDPGAMTLIKSLELDIIYSIRSLPEDERLSEAAAYGVWYIHFGHGKYAGSRIPAFWEVMDEQETSGSYLIIKKGKKKIIAFESTTPSVPYSVRNNFNSMAWKASASFSYKLQELRRTGPRDFFNRHQAVASPPSNPEKHFELPGSVSMGLLFVRNFFRYLKNKIRKKLDQGRFTLLYAFTPFTLEGIAEARFTPMPLPENGFWADPFIMETGDATYIFFEEYSYSEGRGHISAIEVQENGKFGPVRKILERPYHLSYPFIFHHEGTYYMIPETVSNKTVELYKAEEFPCRWSFVMNLMEGKELMDVTLYRQNGKWWLFANSYNHPFVSTNDQLFLFYSQDLHSTEWIAHPCNPIATHAGNCRPAGRIFSYNNKIYRPAQHNASQQYGLGIRINRIEVLNENEYREKEVLSLLPHQLGLRACHHIDFSRSMIVIDGITKNRKPR